jgi:hypothetical protein
MFGSSRCLGEREFQFCIERDDCDLAAIGLWPIQYVPCSFCRLKNASRILKARASSISDTFHGNNDPSFSEKHSSFIFVSAAHRFLDATDKVVG